MQAAGGASLGFTSFPAEKMSAPFSTNWSANSTFFFGKGGREEELGVTYVPVAFLAEFFFANLISD